LQWLGGHIQNNWDESGTMEEREVRVAIDMPLSGQLKPTLPCSSSHLILTKALF
jgi:hypothetical protein